MADNIFWSAIHLGNFADFDTNEGSNTVEDASALIGTFGAGPGEALSNNIVTIDTDTGLLDDSVTTNNDILSNDTVTYNLGGGAQTHKLDSVMMMNGTVTFHDGTSFTSQFAVVQDTAGNTFMLVLDSQPELVSDGIDSVTFTSIAGSNYSGVTQNAADNLDFVCFAPGTKLATPTGEIRADRLRTGDLLTTLDNGPQPILWIGKRRLHFGKEAHPARPIRIRKNRFGLGLPSRDTLLSPNHRLLVTTSPSNALHDPLSALAPAKALTGLEGIRALPGKREITYFTFLLPRHEVVIANGIASESLYPGRESFAHLSATDRAIWLRLAARGSKLFGQPPARLMLGVSETRAGLKDRWITLPDQPPVPLSFSLSRRQRPTLPDHLAWRSA